MVVDDCGECDDDQIVFMMVMNVMMSMMKMTIMITALASHMLQHG